MNLIGVFGGAFDPVHTGHLRTALEMLHTLDLAELRFVPSRVPPHRDPPIASVELRLKMLNAALPSREPIIIDQRELQRAGPSYTVDTLISMRDEFPDESVCLIIGMDAFLAFTTWHRWREILRLAHIVVAYRPGTELPVTGAIGEMLEARKVPDKTSLTRQQSGKILIHPTTQLEISSSAIRRMVGEGGDPRYLVPGPVREIIMESGCYANTVSGNDSQENRFSA